MTDRWTTQEANDVARIVHAFSDRARKDDVRALADAVEARIEELQAARREIARLRDFARDCRDNWDCDEDAHKHGTTCRACDARAVLEPEGDTR